MGNSCLPPWGGSGLKFIVYPTTLIYRQSPSLGREWIEIVVSCSLFVCFKSPSLGREWIEIQHETSVNGFLTGLPPWGGSGLKSMILLYHCIQYIVSLLGEGVD